MAAYQIRLAGCDDATVFVMELTEAEAQAARRIAALSVTASEFGCQPKMSIAPPPKEPDPDD